MGDNDVWCLAWRMIVKYGDDVDAVITSEVDACTKQGDEDGADYWRRVLAAIDDLR